ncbi:MAG: CRISPR-associated endonuclease Cas2 [Candidatus Woesearchaeota archaeon]
MYVILVYDFKESRVAKAYKIVRKYLYWRQRSVFDGEINEEDLDYLIKELTSLMVPEEDYVIIYSWTVKPKNESIMEFGFKRIGNDDIIF